MAEIELRHVVDTKMVDGQMVHIVRNYTICETGINWLAQAQSYFTKDEKKKARLQHKLDLKLEKAL